MKIVGLGQQNGDADGQKCAELRKVKCRPEAKHMERG